MDKVLKNCASHSRYFSDELGALFLKISRTNVCKFYLHMVQFIRKVSDSEQTKRAILRKTGTALNVILSN